MAIAGAHFRRVRLDIAERLDRQPQQVGGDLGIGRLVAHAIGLRADTQADAAVGIETQLGAFVRRAAGGLHEAGDANPAAFPPVFRRHAAHREAAMVGGNDRIVQVGDEAAAVDHRAERLAIRKFVHQIAPPQVDRIEAVAAGGGVDQPLDHVVHFGLAGAAIGIDRHGVGEHPLHVHEDRRNRIAAAHGVGRRIGGTTWTARRKIRAEIGNCGNVQCQEATLVVQREAGAGNIVAALRGGDEVFRALADPLHRPTQSARRPQQHDPFGIQRILHAEPATHVRTGHAHLLPRHAEHAVGKLRLQRVHAGAGEHQMEPTGIVLSDRAPCFRRGDHDSVVDQLLLHCVRSVSHRSGDRTGVALLEAVGQVAVRLRP